MAKALYAGVSNDTTGDRGEAPNYSILISQG
jgi:hypothetical protein